MGSHFRWFDRSLVSSISATATQVFCYTHRHPKYEIRSNPIHVCCAQLKEVGEVYKILEHGLVT